MPIYFADAGPAAPLIKSGQLKALGVTTATRSSNLPDVPTLDEAGVTGYEANTWQMMAGPAHMPEPIVAKLNRALGRFHGDAGGAEVSSPRSACSRRPARRRRRTTHIVKEAARWSQVIKGMGISID